MIGVGSGMVLAAAAVLALAVILAVSVGAVAVPVSTVWGVVLDRLWPGLVTADWSAGQANIVWEIRFPRVILAGLVGNGIGCGCACHDQRRRRSRAHENRVARVSHRAV